MINIRRPISLDTDSMANLLNKIIQEGGTTALTRPVTGKDINEWMQFAPERSAWHVAVNAQEQIVGFQWVEPKESLPAEAVDIATFVEVGQTGLGIGSALFDATKKAAKSIGYSWINANIRADNEGGLIYYQSRGFQDYGVIEGYELADGQIVDKKLKRYEL